MMKEKIVYLVFLRVICAVVVVLDHICIAGIHIFDRNATLFEKFFYNRILFNFASKFKSLKIHNYEKISFIFCVIIRFDFL